MTATRRAPLALGECERCIDGEHGIVNDIMECGSDNEEVWLMIVDMRLEQQGLAFTVSSTP